MIRYENHCCDCAVPGYPCIGNNCPYINVETYYCDVCKDKVEKLYMSDDGLELCEDCMNKVTK